MPLKSLLKLAHVPDGILAHVPHEILRKQNKKKNKKILKKGGRGGDSRETKVFTIPTLLKENTGNGFDHFEIYQRKEPTSQSADFPRSIPVEHNNASKLHVFMWLVVLTMCEVTHTLPE